MESNFFFTEKISIKYILKNVDTEEGVDIAINLFILHSKEPH